jgi:hypothetical protein
VAQIDDDDAPPPAWNDGIGAERAQIRQMPARPRWTSMRSRHFSATAIAAILLLSACGSSGTAPTGAAQTQAAATSGAAATDVAQPTQPAATSGGGGGGITGGGPNTVHFEVISPLVNKTGDLAFVPVASVFGGEANTSLSFSNPATTDVMGILIIGGQVGVSYGTPDFTVAAAPTSCTVSNLHVDASSASGSFDCKDADVLTTAGGIGKGEIKGTFDGHK